MKLKCYEPSQRGKSTDLCPLGAFASPNRVNDYEMLEVMRRLYIFEIRQKKVQRTRAFETKLVGMPENAESLSRDVPTCSEDAAESREVAFPTAVRIRAICVDLLKR